MISKGLSFFKNLRIVKPVININKEIFSYKTFIGVNLENAYSIMSKNHIRFYFIQGIHFAVGTDIQMPYTFYNSDYCLQNNFIPENETYEVTKCLSGVFPTAMNILQKTLNFTYKAYIRKDHIWGLPIKHKNGTYSFPGMYGDLVQGKWPLFTNHSITKPLFIKSER